MAVYALRYPSPEWNSFLQMIQARDDGNGSLTAQYALFVEIDIRVRAEALKEKVFHTGIIYMERLSIID